MFRRRQEFDRARHEQERLRAERQSRERVYGEAHLHASQEMEELKKTQNWEIDELSRQKNRKVNTL